MFSSTRGIIHCSSVEGPARHGYYYNGLGNMLMLQWSRKYADDSTHVGKRHKMCSKRKRQR